MSAYPIKQSEALSELDFDSVIVGTLTGFYEICSQLEQMGIVHEKIDTNHIELSVRAREAFLQDFAIEAKYQNLESSVAELGVYRGDFACFAYKINECFSDRVLYLFDTFDGFWDKDLSQNKDGTIGASLGKKCFLNKSAELVLGKIPHTRGKLKNKG